MMQRRTTPDPQPADSLPPSIPIVPHFVVDISAHEDSKLERLASRIRSDEPAISSTEAFGPRVETGLIANPSVLLGDHSEIPLTSASDVSILEYRILLLAGDADILVIGGERHLAFEDYSRSQLGLGRIEVLTAPPLKQPKRAAMARRCIEHHHVFERLVSRAKDEGHLSIVPHIGTGSAWALARAIANHSRAKICVAAPPPRLTRRVNDKLWFGEQTEAVLGRHSVPRLGAAFGPAALAAQVIALARRSDRVAVKVPDSAGSAGNISLASKNLIGKPLIEVRRLLIEMLKALGWEGTFPLLVQVWDGPVLANPSLQVWIPHREVGLPIVEGIFEQVVEGAEGEFVGAVPSTLPEGLLMRLVSEGTQLARLYQLLGYFGRCSFDAILVGTDLKNGMILWIECNGRWGGVSMPMTLANRLSGDWQTHPFVVVQQTHLHGNGMPFRTALARLGSLLYERGKVNQGVVLLTPGGIESGRAVHLMAIADDIQHARRIAREAVARLLRPA